MVVSLPIVAGFVSFAVDYGQAQLVKTDLRRTADATAHDYMVLYGMSGKSYANTNGPTSYSTAKNPVDSLSGVAPTVSVTWGYWKASTKTFNTNNNGGTTAVKVIASCTKANGNAVPILFGSLLGARSVDVSATSIATYVPATSINVSVSATSDPYFAGMPNNTTSTYGDDAVHNGATEVTALNINPGDILTFAGFTGVSSVLPGYMPYVGPAGATNYYTGYAMHHGENWDGSGNPNGYTENGIADAIMPESALMAMFLNDNPPNWSAAPSSVVDWTNSTVLNQSVYDNLELKAPFLIGTGVTSSGTVKQFVVPEGATRLYIGTWDGLQYSSNAGSYSGTIVRKASVQIVN